MNEGESVESTGGERGRKAAGEQANERSVGPFGGLSASEAGKRSRVAAREKRAAREQTAEQERLTARQRLAAALSLELTVDDWRQVIRAGVATGKVADLARMMDQAFGKSAPEEMDKGDEEDAQYASLTRAQRAALIAKVLEEEEGQRTASGDDADPRDDEAAPPTGGPPP